MSIGVIFSFFVQAGWPENIQALPQRVQSSYSAKSIRRKKPFKSWTGTISLRWEEGSEAWNRAPFVLLRQKLCVFEPADHGFLQYGFSNHPVCSLFAPWRPFVIPFTDLGEASSIWAYDRWAEHAYVFLSIFTYGHTSILWNFLHSYGIFSIVWRHVTSQLHPLLLSYLLKINELQPFYTFVHNIQNLAFFLLSVLLEVLL